MDQLIDLTDNWNVLAIKYKICLYLHLLEMLFADSDEPRPILTTKEVLNDNIILSKIVYYLANSTDIIKIKFYKIYDDYYYYSKSNSNGQSKSNDDYYSKSNDPEYNELLFELGRKTETIRNLRLQLTP